jgi:D-alanine transaminase
MPVVYLNGDFLPLEEARVSVLDRGFTFSDGVYEVLPVIAGKIFRLDEHLKRLDNSLSSIHINNPHTHEEWKLILSEILKRNRCRDGHSVYIQVTRGTGERDHVYAEGMKPTVFVMCKSTGERDLSGGIRAITHDDIRWQYCYIKSTGLLAGVLLRMQAFKTDGSREAILLRNGRLTEGAASNVFIVSGGRVKTPGKDGSILPGITRDLVVELLQKSAYGCIETAVMEDELRSAEEIWITSSTMGIVPVVVLDGVKVGDGIPGNVWEDANTIYMSYIKSDS